ncbi:MAG TPA: cystathionine gamma-synthase family protein [Acidimicrobiia bacterium]|nr:cystathionine gamma-synthase family protein [Acidimicrobiia bacterium]
MPDKELGAGTQAVWGGESRARHGDFTQVPVVHSVSYGYDDVDHWMSVALHEQTGHIYGRNSNPTVAVFEEKIRLLEGGEAATAGATGMASISNTLFALLAPGKRVVSVKDTYGGTNQVFAEYLPQYGVEVALCDTSDHDAIEAEVGRGCDLLYLETPTNPTLKVLDLERLSRAGHDAGAVVVVDNTVATPMNQKPLTLGADLVVHSATKYLGGHADALGGVVVGRADLVEKIYRYREINGSTLHPMAAYLLLRGMKTLHLRVERQNSNAMTVARYLSEHPAVTVVNYPGLESHPLHDVAARQMSGFGGMLSFGLAGEFEAVRKFIPAMERVHAAANLGAVETIISAPATSSHVEVSAEDRAALGIPEGLIRYSVGIEDPDDLIADLEQALAAV